MADFRYKARLFYNPDKNRGLIYKTQPQNKNLFGIACYSNECLLRLQRARVLTRNGYEELDAGMVDIDPSSHLMDLRPADSHGSSENGVDFDGDCIVRIRGIDLANKLTLEFFANIKENGQLPVWVSILMYNRWEYQQHDFRLQCNFDNQRKVRRIWVHQIDELESEIQRYKSDQDGLSSDRVYNETVKQFTLTDKEAESMQKMENLLERMGREDIRFEKFVTTMCSWGVSNNRAQHIADYIETFDYSIDIRD